MFTGLIKEVGKIESITPNQEGKLFTIFSPTLAPEIHIDDSVATNGVCLTATKVSSTHFTAQAVNETLKKSNLGLKKTGDRVNLELALKLSDRLGGHLVQGHVNGTAKIKQILRRGHSYELTLIPDNQLLKYMINEGSVAIDGISLTIAHVSGKEFRVSIIPHTFINTTLHQLKIGDLVNIEVDMMAKYLENFLQFEKRKG